jgi:hypothetical protein
MSAGPVSFVFELCQKALQSLLASMGTTALAVIVGLVVIPGIFLLQKLLRDGGREVIAHWKENIRDGAIATTIVWLLLFSYHLLYKMPREITLEADRQHNPGPKLLGVPGGWDAKSPYPTKEVQALQVAMRFSMAPQSSKGPAFSFVNESNLTARSVRWGIVLWNTEHPEQATTLPIYTYPIEWIKPHDKTGFVGIFTNPLPQLNIGDTLIGSAAVDCPACKPKSYVLYVRWGEGGWYADAGKRWKGKLMMPANGFSRAGREIYFKEVVGLIPQGNRISMLSEK